MEQENMKDTFTNPSIGNNVSSPVDEINEKLDKITSILSDIYNSVSNTKEEVVAPVLDETKVEDPTIDIPEEQTKDMDIPKSIDELKIEDMPVNVETPSVERESVKNDIEPKVVEEEPFTPVSIDELKPVEDVTSSVAQEVNKPSTITPIDEILASETPIEEQKNEVPTVENDTPVITSEEETTEVIKPDVIAPEIETPVVAPSDPVITPVVEPTTNPVIAPEAPVSNPVIAPVEQKIDENVAEPVAETVTENKKQYSIVTNLYAGMTDVKTGNDPHRVVPVNNNEFAKQSSKVNSLIMNKIA